MTFLMLRLLPNDIHMSMSRLSFLRSVKWEHTGAVFLSLNVLKWHYLIHALISLQAISWHGANHKPLTSSSKAIWALLTDIKREMKYPDSDTKRRESERERRARQRLESEWQTEALCISLINSFLTRTNLFLRFASFLGLKTKDRLPKSHFYPYLHIRHFVRECMSEFTTKPKSHTFHDLLLSQPNSKPLISSFVTAFSKPVNASKGLSSIQSCAINSKYTFIQF